MPDRWLHVPCRILRTAAHLLADVLRTGVLAIAERQDDRPGPREGERLEIVRGAILVANVATRAKARVAAGEALSAEEVDAVDTFDAAMGKRKIYTNECNGLCYPFLPADEFFEEAHFPWFAQVEARTDAIREEMLALLADPGDALRPYVRMEEGAPSS